MITSPEGVSHVTSGDSMADAEDDTITTTVGTVNKKRRRKRRTKRSAIRTAPLAEGCSYG